MLDLSISAVEENAATTTTTTTIIHHELGLNLHLHKHIPSIQYQSKTAGYETCHNHQQYIQYNNIEIQNNITTHHNTGQ
jgi:hypothetical protein